MIAQRRQLRSRPPHEDAAEYLAPNDVAPWLPVLISDLSRLLEFNRKEYDLQPKKTEMREKLYDLRDAAATIRNFLFDAPVREFHQASAPIRIKSIGSLDYDLEMLIEGATSASDQMKMRGAGRALPPHALTPQTRCAVFIGEIYKHFNSRCPSPRNAGANAAADALWKASGGEPNGYRGAPGSWKHHFKAARSVSAELDREAIARLCAEYSNLYQRL